MLSDREMALAFGAADLVVFDFDGVAYKISPAIDEMMAIAVARSAVELGAQLTFEEALDFCITSFTKHGTAAAAFRTVHDIDPAALRQAYHAKCDETILPVCDDAIAFIRELARPKVISTHGNCDWVMRGNRQLTLADIFALEDIFCPENTGGYKDSMIEVHQQVIEKRGRVGGLNIMIEDSSRNLVLAKKAGMLTILLTHDKIVDPKDCPYVDYMARDLKELRRKLAPYQRLYPLRRTFTTSTASGIILPGGMQ